VQLTYMQGSDAIFSLAAWRRTTLQQQLHSVPVSTQRSSMQWRWPASMLRTSAMLQQQPHDTELAIERGKVSGCLCCFWFASCALVQQLLHDLHISCTGCFGQLAQQSYCR
jgi:hypothetical protein